MKPIFNPISIGSMLKTILVFCCPLLFSISLVAQSLELEPDSVCITLLSGEETTSQLQINNPDGSDYDFEVVLPELPFDTSVTSFYDFPGDASFFSIPISQLSIEPFEDSLEVSIIVNGDYDSNGEVADILINGMYWGQIGGNGPNGEDQVVEITISGNNLADIVQIGSVDLEIYNFFDVGVGEGGEDRHTVVVRKAGLSWLEISPLEGTVSANQSTALQLSFNTNELPAGTYEVNLPISFDPPNPATLFAKVQLEVTGRTLAVFPEVPFDFGEVLFGDSRQRDFVIENQGSEAYVITDFSVDAPQYSLNVPFTIIDPFSTYSLPISFTPDALGSFPANLTISSTIGDTIIPIIGLGVDPPAISLQPDSICVQLLSGDTETAQLYIDNPGASTLQYEIELIPDPNDFNFAFYEDFEDQDYQPFTLTNPQIFDVSYVTDNTAQGNYSMKLSSQQFGFLEGLQADVNDANIDYFGFSVRSDDASANAEDFSLLLRDFTNGIHDMFFFQRFPGNLLFVSSGVENLQITYTPGEWIHVELKNIDFAQHTYDLYINEDLKKAGIVFDPNVTRFGQINIFNIVGGDTYWDEITAGTGDLVFDWISLSQNSGSVAQGSKDSVGVQFNTAGLLGGTYRALAKVTSNVPGMDAQLVPCKMELTGIARLALSKDEVDFGDTFVGYPSEEVIQIYNAGTEQLLVSEISSTDPSVNAEPAFGIIEPFDSLSINLSYAPMAVGNLATSLLIKSSDRDTTIQLLGNALAAPLVSLNQAAICDTVIAGEQSNNILTVRNEGLGQLDFDFPGAEANNAAIEVLILGYGSEGFNQYDNVVEILEQSNANFEISTTSTSSASELEAALENKAVLVIPEPQFGFIDVYEELAPVVNNFVDNGGTSIFCGIYYGSLMTSTNLFEIFSDAFVFTNTNMTVLDPNHPILEGVDGKPKVKTETHGVFFNNSDLVPIVMYEAEFSIISYREVGQGRAVHLAYDYFDYDQETAGILSNAVNWAANPLFPDWLSVSPKNGSVMPNSSSDVTFTLDGSDLESGYYSTQIQLHSNDPGQDRLPIKVKLWVIAPPAADFSTSSRFNCGSPIRFTDLSRNQPDEWQWDFGDGNGATEASPIHTYTQNGIYDIELIACNQLGCDTIKRLEYIEVDLAESYCDTLLFSNVFNNVQQTNACTGYLFDNGGPNGDYTEGYESTVEIFPGNGQQVRLDFTDFNLEWGDFIRIYDGIGTNIDYRGEWSGFDLPPPIVSTREGLTLQFISDPFQTSSGFEAVWQCANSFPPIASFDYFTNEPCSNFITFFPIIVGAQGVIWEFGDGNTSTELTPSHTYSAPGEYEVNLLAYNATDTTIATETITINNVGLFVELTVPDTAFLGVPTDFSFINTGQVSSVLWDINNGQLVTEQFSTTFTFNQLGTFDYYFAAWGFNGCDYEWSGTVTVVLPVDVDEVLAHDHLAIYPNPSDGLFNLEIDLPEQQDLALHLYNTLGQRLLKQPLPTARTIRESLDLSEWPSGVYYLEISSGDANLRRRLVKQ